MPRFSKDDQLEIARARAILKSPDTSTEEKSDAKKAITRIQTERNRRIEARKLAGNQPHRKDFETEEEYETALQSYWAKLDRAVAEREAWKVLNDPMSSTLVRTRAYERLGIKPPAALGRNEPVPDIPENQKRPTHHCFTDSEIAENRRREQQFYKEIAVMLAAEKEKEKQL